MEAYAEAKRLLYADHLMRPGTRKHGRDPVAVFNRDDHYGAAFADGFAGDHLTYGLEAGADLHASGVEFLPSGVRFRVDTPDGPLAVESHLLGMFNVQNILGALAAALAVGIDRDKALEGIRALRNVRGRFEVDRKSVV